MRNSTSPPDESSVPQQLWRLPFDLVGSGCCHWLYSDGGRCNQGNHGNDTHVRELRFAFDFSMAINTPVLAAADGVVAAAVGCFRAGNRNTKEMRTRANYIALRHAPGLYTRYYHLAHKGVCVDVGERVRAGQCIGKSGNTGFSGAPHLHWDVVDVLPTETATLTLQLQQQQREKQQASSSDDDDEKHDRAHNHTIRNTELTCAAGVFSAALPAAGSPPIRGPAVWADPPTASAAALRNPEAEVRGAVVLIDRCAHVDFLDKARRAQAAGAVAVVVVNHAEAGPATITMGIPAAAAASSEPSSRRVAIPAVFVPHSAGEAVREAIRRAKSGGGAASGSANAAVSPPMLLVGRSEHFRARTDTEEQQGGDSSLPSSLQQEEEQQPAATTNPRPAVTDLSPSDFVPRTLPARFFWPNHPEGYLPISGRRPPKAVQQAGGRGNRVKAGGGGTAAPASAVTTAAMHGGGGGGGGAVRLMTTARPASVQLLHLTAQEEGGT